MSSADPHYLEVRLAHATVRRSGREVLRDVSWIIRPGERWVLAGANGAGKTQLLKLLAGSVWPVPREPPPLRYRLGTEEATTPFGLKDDIAYVGAERQDQYQRYGWNSPAARVVGTGLEHSDIPLERLTAAQRRRIRAVLAALQARHLAARPFLSLSYGERRLILLARALISRPRLLLLDEVLNGLDALNRTRILRWLARARRLPWVLATHRLADVPCGATRALLLNRGRVVYAGALRNAPLSRWLEARGAAPAATAPRRLPRAGARRLVRLTRAGVYLEQRRALTGVSFTVRTGEVWLVHGHNGSGKTTLLRTLYGDCGVAVGGSIERARAAPGVPLESFKRRVGLVAPHLQADHPRELSVTEVVQSGRHASIGLAGAPSTADRAAAQRALASFGLTRLAARRFGELSYGQSRRVLFARAWVREPELLLLDEPFAGIDAPTRHALAERVLTLSVRSTAVVLATHRPDEWRDRATHELELAGGRARYCGPVRAVRVPARQSRSRAR
jgi:molybdate transport system ATP-binding protein